MEAELLAGVIQTDTHKRLQIAEQLIDHFKRDDVFDEFSDIERLIGGLSSWVGSSNFKVGARQPVVRQSKWLPGDCFFRFLSVVCRSWRL